MDLATMVTSNGPDPVAESRRESVYKSPTFQRRTYEHHQETASSKSYFAPSTSTAYTWSPQPPLSPPAEDQRKCSLPSISTLLQGADDLAIHASSMFGFSQLSLVQQSIANSVEQNDRGRSPQHREMRTPEGTLKPTTMSC